MPGSQLELFSSRLPERFPEGFGYHPDAISIEEERRLIQQIAPLPFKEFQFHGFEGKRRVVSFGWRYDFGQNKALPADPIPDFLRDLCSTIQSVSGFHFPDLEQVLVTEYSPGAAIGWHKDRPVFGTVMGLSLASPCTFRLRTSDRNGHWQRVSFEMEPRSAYLLSGEARWKWEHSIPPVKNLRYSITFRSRRSDENPVSIG
jgi:alkylated DNA repair dioxygenase AlkB